MNEQNISKAAIAGLGAVGALYRSPYCEFMYLLLKSTELARNVACC